MCCLVFYVFPEGGGNTRHATAHHMCNTTTRYNFCAYSRVRASAHTCAVFLKLRTEQRAVPIGIALEGSWVTAVGECNPPDDRSRQGSAGEVRRYSNACLYVQHIRLFLLSSTTLAKLPRSSYFFWESQQPDYWRKQRRGREERRQLWKRHRWVNSFIVPTPEGKIIQKYILFSSCTILLLL